jgi:crotonobetainyl-CoA:carnitine CoA-transferase CaiB-like acyl-CoA transferase
MEVLAGIRILDLTRLLPGDAAMRMLGAFGAEVVPVKLPEFDLKTASGKDRLLELVRGADVLVESFRPGVMERLGLGYQTLRAANERLIYAAITGYGQQGPYAKLAGHDVNYLARAGVIDVGGIKDGCPTIPGVQIADLAGGSMQAVIGILLALMERQKTGRGRMVDVSMMHGALWMMAIPLLLHGQGRPTARGASFLTGRYACYRLYDAADGRWLSVGALEPKFWANLCRVLGCEEFIADQFTEGWRQEEIVNRVAAIFRTRTAAEWMALCGDQDVCVAPVRTVAEVVEEFGGTPPVIPKMDGDVLGSSET